MKMEAMSDIKWIIQHHAFKNGSKDDDKIKLTIELHVEGMPAASTTVVYDSDTKLALAKAFGDALAHNCYTACKEYYQRYVVKPEPVNIPDPIDDAILEIQDNILVIYFPIIFNVVRKTAKEHGKVIALGLIQRLLDSEDDNLEVDEEEYRALRNFVISNYE
jgi:hypothetical protein